MAPDLRDEWLEPFDWSYVTQLNAQLCQLKNALHKPTSDGYDEARHLWEESRDKILTIEEALIVCYRCHQLGPFCFFNGNTFVAIARGFIKPVLEHLMDDDGMKAAMFRSVVGHFVAGTEGLEELRQAIKEALKK